MFVLRMRTFGRFDILLFSSLGGVAVNRDNDICRCAHIEVFLAGLWCFFFFTRLAVVDGKQLFLQVLTAPNI